MELPNGKVMFVYGQEGCPVWFALESSSFLVGGPSSLAKSGGVVSSTRCMVTQPFAANENRPYLDF
jgi:hypothetical protein